MKANDNCPRMPLTNRVLTLYARSFELRPSVPGAALLVKLVLMGVVFAGSNFGIRCKQAASIVKSAATTPWMGRS
jgi:hypothetical protein